MIITRAPFRVSFCGGGSDLASFYEEHGGCVISTSINKFMYLTIHPYFDSSTTVLKYSKTECAKNLDDIEHNIFRTVLKKYNLSGVEMSSIADVPAGTGLGSSSTFTVALLNAVNAYCGKFVSKNKLAQMACDIEIEDLKSPIGKQDQYAAAHGGLNFISFHQNGEVTVEPLIMNKETYKLLQENLLMFYTGETRSANNILSEQNKNMGKTDKVKNLLQMCDLAKKMRERLQNNDLSAFGKILNEGWELKKTLASGISDQMIDEKYQIAMQSGALGGKLLGAGGGGFLLFYCEKEHQEALRKNIGLKELSFEFDNSGASTIFVGDKYWA